MPHRQVPVHTAEPEKQALDPKTRQSLLRLLAGMPGVVEAVRAASTGQTFRAVMSEKNAHLFKKGVDGLYKPGLQKAGKFVENISLDAVSFDYARLIADLSMSVALAGIVAKLEAIQADLRDIKTLIADVNRGEALGTPGPFGSAVAGWR